MYVHSMRCAPPASRASMAKRDSCGASASTPGLRQRPRCVRSGMAGVHAHHYPPTVGVDHALEDDRYERPPSGTMHEGIFVMQNDARMALMEAAYQWVDLDPFGSPVNFLDAAVQGAFKGRLS